MRLSGRDWKHAETHLDYHAGSIRCAQFVNAQTTWLGSLWLRNATLWKNNPEYQEGCRVEQPG